MVVTTRRSEWQPRGQVTHRPYMRRYVTAEVIRSWPDLGMPEVADELPDLTRADRPVRWDVSPVEVILVTVVYGDSRTYYVVTGAELIRGIRGDTASTVTTDLDVAAYLVRRHLS